MTKMGSGIKFILIGAYVELLKTMSPEGKIEALQT
jgi:hypothetical protein